MNKYKRRTINQKAHLHDKEFVEYDDVEQLIIQVVNEAVRCGADKIKLERFFSNEKT